MIIEPRIRGFICMTAHPTGCSELVTQQINYIKNQPAISGPKNVLIIGASTGFGLASRIVTTFACGANTVGVFFERPASKKRTASAGWYNTVAFEHQAMAAGHQAWSINGDAFSNEIRNQTIRLVAERLGQLDLIVYSLASPRRIDPDSGETYNSVLKPIGSPYDGKTIDPHLGEITEIKLDPASDKEISSTIAVMGGDDWSRWTGDLNAAGLIKPECLNVAYTYVGPDLTKAIYRNGTIGRAKEHLENTAISLNREFPGQSLISVNKALVTQSSAAIPIVPLYLMILFQAMKERGTHEGAIQQIYRLLSDRLYKKSPIPTDSQGRVRIDDWEMDLEVQRTVEKRFKIIVENSTKDHVKKFADIEGYRRDFLHLFGFGFSNINYNIDVNPEALIPSIKDIF